MTTQDHEAKLNLIYVYSRRQAIQDGLQMDVSKVASEAGITIPTFITEGVYAGCVAVPPGIECQDESGRLWDVVSMLVWAIRRSAPRADRLSFQLYVRNSNDEKPALVTLDAVCGALDFDDPQPAFTIMLPGED